MTRRFLEMRQTRIMMVLLLLEMSAQEREEHMTIEGVEHLEEAIAAGLRRLFDRRRLVDHLGFGLLFFLGGLLLTAIWRLGEVTLLVFSAGSAEVAFFNVAVLVTLLVAGMMAQLASKGVDDVGDTDPLDSGIIDSMGILQFVSFLEFGIAVEDEEIVPDNFGTVADITALVETKRGGTG